VRPWLKRTREPRSPSSSAHSASVRATPLRFFGSSTPSGTIRSSSGCPPLDCALCEHPVELDATCAAIRRSHQSASSKLGAPPQPENRIPARPLLVRSDGLRRATAACQRPLPPSGGHEHELPQASRAALKATTRVAGRSWRR
jgi:hypothetical protein